MEPNSDGHGESTVKSDKMYAREWDTGECERRMSGYEVNINICTTLLNKVIVPRSATVIFMLQTYH